MLFCVFSDNVRPVLVPVAMNGDCLARCLLSILLFSKVFSIASLFDLLQKFVHTCMCTNCNGNFINLIYIYIYFLFIYLFIYLFIFAAIKMLIST